MRYRVSGRRIFEILMLLLVVGSFLTAQAQSSNALTVESISAKHGVYFSDINDLLQDNFGFIWFASQDGIARFDGYDFEFFRHDVVDTTSISHHHVREVAMDNDGNIWAGSTHGISKFDRKTKSFTRYYYVQGSRSSKGDNNVGNITFDKDGTMWTSSSSRLFRLEVNAKEFEYMNGIGTPLAGVQIRELFTDLDGDVWCATSGGLFLIRRSRSGYTFQKIAQETYHSFDATEKGKIVCASNSTVTIIDKTAMSIEQVELQADQNPRSIRNIIVDESDLIWIVYTSGEISVVDKQGSLISQFASIDATNTTAPHSRIMNILEDSQGVLWLISVREIFKHVPGYPSFQSVFRNESKLGSNPVDRVISASDGALWAVTNHQIFRQKPDGSVSSYVLGDNLTIGDGLIEDHNGNIWVNALGVGFYTWDTNSDKFRPNRLDDKLGKTLIYQFIRDKSDPHIGWAGTRYGLVKVNFKELSTKWFDPKNDIEGQPTARVAVFDDRNENELWCYNTYFNSISKFDKRTEKFYALRPRKEQQYVLEGDVKDMTITNDGVVWIATLFGLTRFEPQDSSFSFYTSKDGLAQSGIVSLSYTNSMLWLAGDQFVASKALNEESFENYDLSRASGFFITKSACNDPSGNITFGTVDGAIRIQPDEAPLRTELPKVYITGVRINDTRQIGTTGHTNEGLELAYDENEITFEFTGLNSIDPQNNQYKCKLAGYDEDWRLLDDQRSVRYTNLNHGDYVFSVLASNGHGEWSAEPAQISIAIAPSIWETNLFKVIVVIVIGILIYLITMVRQRQITLQKERDLAERSARYKSNFLANVSHEIRTPMNAILGMTELAIDSNTEKERSEYLGTIQNASSDLLQILNELLDHSKLESGTFNFEMRDFELDHVLNHLRIVFQAIAQRKGLEFNVQAPDSSMVLNGDPVRLKQILTNLLSNAMKYTSAGKVELSIEEVKKHNEFVDLKFEVADSGKGIPSEQLNRVFDRFEAGAMEMEDQSGSTGLGLYITKQLVDRQGGSINMTSAPGKGTRVTVDLQFKLGSMVDQQDSISSPAKQLPNKLDVLIAEDSPVNQMLLRKLLESEIPGIQISIADNGARAIEQVEANVFDVIFMDIKMPELNGYQATRTIRAMKDDIRKNIPVIGVTASAMPEQIQECLDSGMTGVVTKPINKADLIDKLSEAIKSTAI